MLWVDVRENFPVHFLALGVTGAHSLFSVRCFLCGVICLSFLTELCDYRIELSFLILVRRMAWVPLVLSTVGY